MNLIQKLKAVPPPPAIVNGPRVFRLVAVQVVCIGFLLVIAGTSLTGISRTGIDRYHKTTGKLVRIFSDEDQAHYHSLQSGLLLGISIAVSGCCVAGYGALSLYRPGLLMPVMRLGGVVAKESKG
jgi:hypothetical protein